METLRHLVVLAHIVGFAVLFGAWAVQAFGGERKLTRLMDIGVGIAGIAGLALAAPWGISWEPGASFYIKVGVKLVVLVIIGALVGSGVSRQKRGQAVAPAVFWLVGILTLANAGMGVIWR